MWWVGVIYRYKASIIFVSCLVKKFMDYSSFCLWLHLYVILLYTISKQVAQINIQLARKRDITLIELNYKFDII